MSRQPLVMVVEDDEEMNELQRELLAVHGLRAVPAYSGAEAMEVSRRCDADAVLLDLMLPEMDGFETCQRLRRDQRRRLAIVVITAMDSELSRRRSFEVGADAYFAKPFDPSEVIETLWKLLNDAGGEAKGRC